MRIFVLIGNYGFSAEFMETDLVYLRGKRTGYRIFWGSTYEPLIDEAVYWQDFGETAAFRYELSKKGKKFDEFYLQGPLVRFGGMNG